MNEDECLEICDLLEKACLAYNTLDPIDKAKEYIKTVRELLAYDLLACKTISDKNVPHYLLQICALKYDEYPEDSNVVKCFNYLKIKYLNKVYEQNKSDVDNYVDSLMTRILNGESVNLNKYEKIVGLGKGILTSSTNTIKTGITRPELEEKIRIQHCAMLSKFPSEYLREYEDSKVID